MYVYILIRPLKEDGFAPSMDELGLSDLINEGVDGANEATNKPDRASFSINPEEWVCVPSLPLTERSRPQILN